MNSVKFKVVYMVEDTIEIEIDGDEIRNEQEAMEEARNTIELPPVYGLGCHRFAKVFTIKKLS